MIDTTRRKPDYALLAAVGMLVPFGLVMVYSASFMDAMHNHDNQLYYLFRQLGGALIGTTGLLVAQRIDYRFWRRYSVPIMAGALGLLLLVLALPDSLTTVNSAKSWIRIGFFSIQPSEVAKLAMIIYFADWLSRRGAKIGNVTYGLIPFAVIMGIVCGLVMLGGDLGTTIVLAVIGVTVFFAAGANVLHLLAATAVAGAAFFALVKVAAFRQERIDVWLNGPWDYYLGAGYQPAHALYALGTGSIFGVGLGQGRQKFLWLPQAHTDAIFAIIGEELGMIGTLFVVGCFMLIAYRGFKIAGRAPDPFAALLAVGLTAWLVFQAMINIGVVTTLLPFTGLTMPFISYGSTSLYMTMIAAGILLNISRHTITRSPGDDINGIASVRRNSPSFADTVVVWWRDGRARLSGAGRGRGAPKRATGRTGAGAKRTGAGAKRIYTPTTRTTRRLKRDER
ncbi:MAG: putative lipid II flippase FtsW [Roseiflexaceae bacterium]|nr:putative lipid II flippase FtsW [Roseiflexaceae bacterium]